MTKENFKDLIENGSDILFDVSGKHYAIFTWSEEGILIGEQHSSEPCIAYPTEQDLLDHFLVNGIPLGELAEQIEITEYA